MPALVYVAVLVSALLHALWNAILKRQADPEVGGAGIWMVCALGAWLAAVPALLRGWPPLTAVGWSGAAGAFEAVYIVSLSRALVHAPLGSVYTISRGGALFVVWPLSVALLGERVSPTALAGTLLIALGLGVTGLGGPRRRGAAAAGLVLACVAAVGIAGYHLCYKQALAASGSPAIVFAISLGVAGPVNLARLPARARASLRRVMRERPWPIVAGGALATTSFLIFLFALVGGGAGAVLTLRNTSILFAQGMAWAIGERPTRNGVTGAVIVAAGAMLLGL